MFRFLALKTFVGIFLISGLSFASTNVHQIFEYVIEDGWGAKSWNTPETMFRLRVGDTFRVKNLDTTAQHTLHSSGKACPHGGNYVYDSEGKVVHEGSNTESIPVGGWLDCILKAPIDNSDGGTEMYDHFQFEGDEGRIYLVVTK